MTIELHDAVNADGLFDILGKAFFAIDTLNTSRASAGTVPAEFTQFIAQFELNALSVNPAWQAAMAGVAPSLAGWQYGGDSLAAAVAGACQQLVIRFVQADTDTVAESLSPCLQYLIDQMTVNGSYVNPAEVSIVLTPDAGNAGDVAIAVSFQRGDGQEQQNMLAETIAASVTAAGILPTVTFRGEVSVANKLSQDWPGGSGCVASTTATAAASNMLSNGSFASATVADNPDNWIITVGTPGTHIKIVLPETQTVVIGGTPTSGYYHLKWTAAGITRSTAALAYNASGSAIQTALRQLPGLDAVTVTTTGTTPNFTHTINFVNVGGDASQLTSVSHLTGGSPTITHATTNAANPASYSGHSLIFVAGATLSTIYHQLPILTPDTIYFVHFRAWTSGSPMSGEIVVEIVNGIGGSVTSPSDAAAAANSLSLNPGLLPVPGQPSSYSFAFSLKPTELQPVYLGIRTSSALTAGMGDTYFDAFALASSRELYPGGPFVAVFDGRKTAAVGDNWSLVVANDRSGKFQEWFNRAFGMAGYGLLLPSAGSTLIDDALIA